MKFVRIYCGDLYTWAELVGPGRWVCAHCKRPVRVVVG